MNSVKLITSLSTAVVPVVLALLVVACSKPTPVEEPIRAVKVITVGLESIQAAPEFAGEVRAQVESRLGFRVGGKITRRQVELGQHVKAGQVLAQLDPQDYKLAADAARAQLSAAASNRDLAAADFKRFKELKDQNFISAAELERRDTTLKAAQSQFEQAQSQLSGQGNQLAYATLAADVAGVVTSVDAEPGQVVAAGTPVVRVAQDGPRDAVFSVPEDKVAAIKVGSAVTVKVWSSTTTINGLVREVAASADPVTRTFAVKVSLPVKEAPALGTTVSVLPQALSRGAVPVLKLPTSALRQEGNSTAVWMLDGASMTVKLVPVQVATADGNDVVVIGGLQPGMQVVVAGVHVLQPGQKVTVYKPNQPLAPVLPARAAINSVAIATPAANVPANAAVAK
ncbi:MAG: efflux RND transporter periplasmic adaptor subunit [Rhodoferax sp.]|uniref:efflux RND transporter periplasmic adaptor subunit n=1 Tax=Rhodoferax sp. TaxID=50421 RepID=UPI0030164A17